MINNKSNEESSYVDVSYSKDVDGVRMGVTYSEALELKKADKTVVISLSYSKNTGAPTTELCINPLGTATVTRFNVTGTDNQVSHNIFAIKYSEQKDDNNASGTLDIGYFDEGDEFVRNYDDIGRIKKKDWLEVKDILVPLVFVDEGENK